MSVGFATQKHWETTGLTRPMYRQLHPILCILFMSCSDQVEKHHPDGRREIIFPDKSVKYIYPSGEEMSIFTDGAVERLSTDGSRTIEFPNGQKEIHTKGHKVRYKLSCFTVCELHSIV